MPKVSTSYKPGQSGNPKGRPPKGYSITDWFKQMFTDNPEVREKFGRSIVNKAMRGDVAAQRLVWGYMDGQPKMTGEVTGSVTITFHDSLKQDDEAETV